MYGTVRPFSPDLYVREDRYYKSVYCGLCRSMKKHTTEISCASLSFDMTFFALVRIWLTEERGEIKMRRCGLHPLRRRPMMCDTEALGYTAYISAYLAYYKLCDDVADGRGIKKLFAKIARAFSKIPMKKVPNELAPVGESIKKHLSDLSGLERNRCRFPSEAAECFGALLGDALSFGLEGGSAAIASEIGRHVGRWVYLADAAVDIDEDRRTGSYNPFLCSMSDKEADEFIENGLDGVLSMELVDALRAFELGPHNGGECAGCISNILREGMRITLGDALRRKREKKEKRSNKKGGKRHEGSV